MKTEEEISALADWLAGLGISKVKAAKYARPLVLEHDVASSKKAVSLHKRGKLEAALMAAGMDEDNVVLVLEELLA